MFNVFRLMLKNPCSFVDAKLNIPYQKVSIFLVFTNTFRILLKLNSIYTGFLFVLSEMLNVIKLVKNVFLIKLFSIRESKFCNKEIQFAFMHFLKIIKSKFEK